MRARATAVWTLGLLALAATTALAQPAPARAPDTPSAAEEPAADPFGRTTPRGTVMGFLTAARKGEFEVARQYLDTRLSAQSARSLAHQVFVVLDARLPARLTAISDAPEGSRANRLAPDRETIGTIASAAGDIDIVVERVTRGRSAVWLFSEATLDAIPRLYEEVTRETVLPAFLASTRVAGLRLIEWAVLLLGIPLFFVATALLNRILVPLIRFVWRRRTGTASPPLQSALPLPARLLLLSLAGRFGLTLLPLSLMVRQFWSSAATLVTIVSVVWLLILLNGAVEDTIRRRMTGGGAPAAVSLLRVIRRVADLLVLFAGLLVMLRRFGVNPTPALAGLGVGGIAVALAAQKSLENVIAGASLIFDQAVRVGDFLRVGTIEGTVDYIGLRSTRIRTLDRTIVSVPNSQIATVSLETLSARDKYWFHPEVRLRYDTTARQLQAVLDGIRLLLDAQAAVDRETVRVRLVRLGQSSFDVEVFAYAFARDWSHFLELQEELLIGITEAVERAGTGLALPVQTLYVAGGEAPAAMLPQAGAAG